MKKVEPITIERNSLREICRRHYLLVAIFIFLTSCSGEYVGMPRAEVLDYQTAPTYGGLFSLATAYGEAINQAVAADTLHPGMYAEYGVTLALMGRKDAACRMLNNEAVAFPESRGLVRRIKQRLMPDLLNDTMASGRDTANMMQLAEWAYDSLTALRPLPYVAPVIDSTDTAWISKQTPLDSVKLPLELTATEKRELLEKQQAEAAMHQQFIADSIAAAKKAVIDARKQAKADREQAKKDKEKARKTEKKAREKQRNEERKQKATQRDEEKKVRDAEKKAQEKAKAQEKKEKEAAREAERKEKAAQREAEREQKAAQREAERQQREAERKNKAEK